MIYRNKNSKFVKNKICATGVRSACCRQATHSDEEHRSDGMEEDTLHQSLALPERVLVAREAKHSTDTRRSTKCINDNNDTSHCGHL